MLVMLRYDCYLVNMHNTANKYGYPVRIDLTVADRKKLRIKAAELNISQSALISRIIREWLEQEEKPQNNSTLPT